MIPKATRIHPENDFQKIGGIPIKAVLAFRINENTIIETLREAIITRGIFLLFPSSALAPRTIGKSGKTHGARTVRTPNKNDMASKVMFV